MIVKNEEHNIRCCLESALNVVDQIVLVDTGSTDSTLSIAKEYTKDIYFYKWNNDFSAARNYSLEKAEGDWILVLDADEEIPLQFRQKIVDLTHNKKVEGYFFKTINFVSSYYNNKDIIINLNFRLFQNRPQYRFIGKTQDQIISNIRKLNKFALLKSESIEIYHYGYFKKNIEKKQWRYIKMEIPENFPDNLFIEFNLANKYYSSGNYENAIPLYLKSIIKCDPQMAYSTKIVIKLVLCYIEVLLYEEAYKWIILGIGYYPKLSDFYYLMSIVHTKLSRPTLAIADLEKCLELGEPPQEISFFNGTIIHRATEKLANIYDSLEDYEKCLKYSIETLKYNSNNISIIYSIFRCLYQLKFSEGEIERNINYIFKDTLELNINLIASILICEGDYSLALKYLDTVQADNTDDQLIYLKGLCQFRLSDFQECIRLFSDIKLQEIKKETIIYKFWAYMNSNISSSIDEIMNGEEKECRVCKSYNMIINSQTPNVLTDDKEISKI
jgi:glycosyltransferase involved in cell wall biosynthesis